ncbi:hypothetical protein AX15_006947 [Amanita polypyramis BW_CC]|nr:hypothetical protein AX15_006947 [Amanita polypyramis BW_CC]
MKGCLKQLSPMPSPQPDCACARKCVAFEADGREQVFFADEWDRTPTEPTRKLSYQDLIELKEIQRSLPLANQPPDPILGRPGRQYLSTVPIGLLPLLPQADATGNIPNSPQTTPHRNIIASRSRCPSQLPQPSQLQSPPSTHQRVLNPTRQRLRPGFAFLPLLDSDDSTLLPSNPSSRSQSPELPSDTDQSLDPPTPSLTNASLDSSPMSHASSSSPEPTFLQLPPRHPCAEERYYNHFGPRDSYFPLHTGEIDVDEKSTSGHPVSHPHCNDPSTFHPPKQPSSTSHRSDKPVDPLKRPRKRNVIVVNDIEIELDDDESDDESSATGTSPSPVTNSNLDHRLRLLSLEGTRHPNCPENLKPPETKLSYEIKVSSSPSPDNCTRVVGGDFGLHAPLRFKRRAPTDTSDSNFYYTGRS